MDGYIYSHHFAHACYAHFSCKSDSTLIMSHDGSLPFSQYRSGALYIGNNNSVHLVSPHYLSVGKMYEVTSGYLGFSEDSGPGKMMGLAPYGSVIPIPDEEALIGNYFEHIDNHSVSRKDYRNWVYKLCDHIISHGIDLDIIQDSSDAISVSTNPMDTRCTSLAATIQHLSERIISKTCLLASNQYRDSEYYSTNSLFCLTGGTALNCPANSTVVKDLPSSNIYVPPAVHDAGLSIGSSLHLSAQINPRSANTISHTSSLNLIFFQKVPI